MVSGLAKVTLQQSGSEKVFLAGSCIQVVRLAAARLAVLRWFCRASQEGLPRVGTMDAKARYGTVPHGGFGLGFERLVMFTTGIENIRETLPFPRWPGNADG